MRPLTFPCSNGGTLNSMQKTHHTYRVTPPPSRSGNQAYEPPSPLNALVLTRCAGCIFTDHEMHTLYAERFRGTDLHDTPPPPSVAQTMLLTLAIMQNRSMRIGTVRASALKSVGASSSRSWKCSVP